LASELKLVLFWEAGSQAAGGLADWTAGAGDHPPATDDHAESLFLTFLSHSSACLPGLAEQPESYKYIWAASLC
jgi:hypothetical protein